MDEKIDIEPPTSTVNTCGSVPNVIVNISSAATYYLKLQGTYSAGTPQFTCRLTAIRIA